MIPRAAHAVGDGIDVVFFDMGNVLLKFNALEIARKVAWALRRHPLQVVRYLWHSDIGRRVERGDISPRRLYGMFRSELEFEGDYEDFRLLWSDHFTLDRGAAAILKKISKRRRVYLLSNTNQLHYEFIRRRYSFVKHISGAILSYRVGMCKPEPAIFKAALRRARVRPSRALFIDDLAGNVEAASKLGIRAIQYTGAASLSRDLANLGIL